MITGYNILISMIFEICIAISMIFILLLFLQKYFKKRTKPRKYILLAMLFWALSGITTAIGRVLKYINLILNNIFETYTANTYIPDFYIILAITFFAVANIFLMIFLKIFFNKSKKLLIIYIIFDSFAIISLFWLSLMIDYLGTYAESIFSIIWSYSALCTLFVSGYMTIIAFNESKKATKNLIKKGSQYIGFSGISMSLINIFFVIDELIVPGFGGAFSIFYYLAWICAILSEIFVYIGFILPDWIRKRWEK